MFSVPHLTDKTGTNTAFLGGPSVNFSDDELESFASGPPAGKRRYEQGERGGDERGRIFRGVNQAFANDQPTTDIYSTNSSTKRAQRNMGMTAALSPYDACTTLASKRTQHSGVLLYINQAFVNCWSIYFE